MTEIKYSTNWNNKLDCPVHTTFRLANSNYRVGAGVTEVLERGNVREVKGPGEIILIYQFKLNDIPEYFCLLDTGYNKADFVKLVQTMYKNKNIDFDKQLWYLLFIKKQK